MLPLFSKIVQDFLQCQEITLKILKLNFLIKYVLFFLPGFGIKLNCSVFCETNKENDCHASWDINGKPVKEMDGYNQTTQM